MVTFETKCWENDWEFILGGHYLDEMIDRCDFTFKERVLMINNVRNLSLVKRYADKKLKSNTIDAYYVVDEFAPKVLDFFHIEKDSFKGGYVYSIAELTSIYLCKTDYLLHFSGDSYMQINNSHWIDKSLDLFSKRTDVVVANPTWNFMYEGVKAESFIEIDNFFINSQFSDQCYLIKTEVFKQPIYNETNKISDTRFPKYGGELFEKRVEAYMHNHNLHRITSKDVSYIHRNFPKNINQRRMLKAKIYFLPMRFSMPNSIIHI
jgi:hypothetical protein